LRVRLADDVRRHDGGRLLVGGSPLITQRLRRPLTEVDADTAVGQRWLDTGLGVPVLDDVAPASPADLTVVVPVLDDAVDVAALAPLRVIVVDDGSRVPVPGADVVRHEENRGPAEARNTGLARVTTPLVAFVDADVVLTADDLLALTRHFADPRVAAVAPRVRGTGGRGHSAWWQRYDAAFSPLDLGAIPAPVRPGSRVAYLPTACLVARTDALGDGFDASLRLGEDVDLVWRLVGSGHRVRYDPSVVVGHRTRGSLRGWLGRYLAYGSSGAPLAARHGGAVAPAVLNPALAAAGLAMLTRRRWALPVAAAVTARAMRRLPTLPPGERARLAAGALGWSVRQEASLAARHWWPVAAIAAAVSPRARRIVTSAVAADTLIALADRRGLDPLTLIAGRRLTDLAYGSGLWLGCLRARNFRALVPRAQTASARNPSIR